MGLSQKRVGLSLTFYDRDFYEEDICTYVFIKKNVHYYQMSKRSILLDTFYPTFGFKFLKNDWSHFNIKGNYTITGYRTMLDKRINRYYVDPNYSGQSIPIHIPQFKIFYRKD